MPYNTGIVKSLLRSSFRFLRGGLALQGKRAFPLGTGKNGPSRMEVGRQTPFTWR